MIHNLTDKQLQALRWLVKQVNDNVLGERFVVTVANHDKRLLLFDERHLAPPCMDIGVLEVLSTFKIVVRGSWPYEPAYTLTRTAYEIVAFDFDNPEPDPLSFYMKEAYRLIKKHFNREELEGLCLELDVKPDWIFGDKTDWPLYLLLHLYRQNQLDKLSASLQELRPGVDWPAYPGDKRPPSNDSYE